MSGKSNPHPVCPADLWGKLFQWIVICSGRPLGLWICPLQFPQASAPPGTAAETGSGNYRKGMERAREALQLWAQLCEVSLHPLLLPQAMQGLLHGVWNFCTVSYNMPDADFAAGPQPPVRKKRKQSVTTKSAGKWVSEELLRKKPCKDPGAWLWTSFRCFLRAIENMHLVPKQITVTVIWL